MLLTRSNNYDYGCAFEQAIVNVINCSDWNMSAREIDAEMDAFSEESEDAEPLGKSIYNFDIDPDDIDEIYADAKKAVLAIDDHPFLSADIGAYRVADWRFTESCDIKLANDVELEVKYVQSAKCNGTYYNTSLEKVADAMGFDSYVNYLEDSGYYELLEQAFEGTNFKVKRDQGSLVTKRGSKWMRHSNEEDYETLSELEYAVRQQWVEEFYNYMVEEEKLSEFLDMVIGRDFSFTKHTPDMFMVYCRDKADSDPCKFVTAKEIQYHDEEDADGALANCSIVFDGLYVTFSWQNGAGLNNPTMRAYLT